MAGRPGTFPQQTSLVTHPWVIGGLLLIVFGVAAKFIGHYAIGYFRWEQAYFDRQGYWPHRWQLITHISGGMLALVCGPFQFWMGLREKAMTIHRWTGRLYLAGVVVGVTGAFLMAVYTEPHSFGVALMGLACAWIVTSGIAYAAIMRGMVALHKEWMARSYIVAFAFVTFRYLNELPIIERHWGGYAERLANVTWVSWLVPLAMFEVILETQRMWHLQSAN